MSRPTKTLDARERLGVYKRIEDVPDRYRLYQHADAYAGRDVWAEFCEQHEYAKGDSDSFKRKVDRAGDLWRAFMDGRRHHALATPGDVDGWSRELLDEYTHNTAYKYWIRVEHFYRWLQWHTEHPHVYHPALMAAAEHDATGEIWENKVGHVTQKREGRA
jgi:hypothetical protein